MSHLLANPMQRPYLFELPRPAHPLTPPDTDNEFATQPFPSAPVASTSHAADQDFTTSAEAATPFYRKPSSFAYVNSGFREQRERVPPRSLIKWLVVVIPPASFTREHGHLGHTLSTGSPNRLSQGILMPLFPTMGGQLAAIAREFSMPSTAGICLYLHTTHNSIALYPRISDDTWHILWAHLFEARSPAPAQQQLPISGQIEFDIDLMKARWYDSWIASPRREFADVPHSVAHSRRQSMTHWRGDSRTTFLDDQADEQLDNISIVQQSRGVPNAPRLGPKKLSLLDRFDASSAISGMKPPRHLSPHSPTDEAHMRMLSPIAQAEEPKTAKKDIDSFVTSWRASATLAASPLAATGQTSLDPANMPNTIADFMTANTPDDHSELNLDDYAWSVSSMGPPDYDLDDDAESFAWRLPSPDLARRTMSDVPPTPSTATSWGAPLSYPPSPVDNHSMYAPSIDIAGRTMYSRPVTPATATSWGPGSYPASPAFYQPELRVPSPDLGARGMLSVPPTPATATSWGAPSYPASPAQSDFRAPSPDLGARGMLSVPPTPATATSWGAPSYPVSPAYSEFRVSSPDLGARMLSAPVSPLPFRRRERAVEVEGEESPNTPSRMVFPYYHAPAPAWQHVWPYESAHEDQPSHEPSFHNARPSQGNPSQGRPARLAFPYYTPSAQVWLHVWPYTREVSKPAASSAPRSPTWEHVWPYTKAETSSKVNTSYASSGYPYIVLYPAVYPNFDIYPSTVRMDGRSREVSVRLTAVYPALQMYPAVYPNFDIYPAIAGAIEHRTSVQKESREMQALAPPRLAQYPEFNLYPPVYPWNLVEIYPARRMAGSLSTVQAIDVRLPVRYPTFDLYPAVYPHSVQRIYPTVRPGPRAEHVLIPSPSAIVVALPVSYPRFDIYPAVYPHNLTIYPSATEDRQSQVIVTKLPVHYPSFEIYRPVYPHSLSYIYPSKTLQEKSPLPTSSVATAGIVSSAFSRTYPDLVLYPSVYPWNVYEIYPSRETASRSTPRRAVGSVPIILEARYPEFNIYPAVYPFNLDRIYPTIGTPSEQSMSNTLRALYPHLEIYAPVYPHNLAHIYPPIRIASPIPARVPSTSQRKGIWVSLVSSYPYICLYPPVYPSMVIYPEVASAEPSQRSREPKIVVNYPAFDIYPAVYPFIRVYPTVWRFNEATKPSPRMIAKTPLSAPRRKPKFTHMDLHEQVFGTAPVEDKPVTVQPSTSPLQRVQQESSTSAHLRSRSRSGTVSMRPSPPPKPADISSSKIAGPSSPAPNPATSVTPRLPITHAGRRPVSTIGLPSHPAANRRMSVLAAKPRSTTPTTLPTVVEPQESAEPSRQRQVPSSYSTTGAANLRSIPRIDVDGPPQDASTGQSVSATLPSKLMSTNTGAELNRAKTLPGRRASAVMQRARAFNQPNSASTDDPPARITMSTLSQFPTPPRPPVPPVPSGRPVSKLDRSKYPFS